MECSAAVSWIWRACDCDVTGMGEGGDGAEVHEDGGRARVVNHDVSCFFSASISWCIPAANDGITPHVEEVRRGMCSFLFSYLV